MKLLDLQLFPCEGLFISPNEEQAPVTEASQIVDCNPQKWLAICFANPS